MTKKSKQKLEYLKNEKSFYGEMKDILKGFQLPKIVSNLRVRLQKKRQIFPNTH